MNEWIHDSPLKDITFEAIVVMPSLLLQKPSRKSKSKDHLKSLENRMKLWHAEEIMQLLKEAETIQKDLRVSNTPLTTAEIPQKFTREMRKDKYQWCDKAFSRQYANKMVLFNQMIKPSIR